MISEYEFIELKNLGDKDYSKASILLISNNIYSHNAMRDVCRKIVGNHCPEFTAIGEQHEVWHLICDEVCAFDYDNDDEHYAMTKSYKEPSYENIESWAITSAGEQAVVIIDNQGEYCTLQKVIEEVIRR